MTTPSYYKHPSGLQPYQIAMHLPTPLGDGFIYVARAGKKEGVPAASDIRKALDQFKFERERREEGGYERPSEMVRQIILERIFAWAAAEEHGQPIATVLEGKNARLLALNSIVHAACQSDLTGLAQAEHRVREFGRSLGVDV